MSKRKSVDRTIKTPKFAGLTQFIESPEEPWTIDSLKSAGIWESMTEGKRRYFIQKDLDEWRASFSKKRKSRLWKTEEEETTD